MSASIKDSTSGRTGRYAKLRELSVDDKLGKIYRGWLRQELNQIKRVKRSSVRLPPNKVLAHKRVYEAAKGFGYKHSVLQSKDLHLLQHKYDNFGRKNKTPRIPR